MKIIYLLSVIVYAVSVAADDFYEILGVDRQATTKEIRRAFKQIALEKHPDKNNDPDAHDKFLRINRAYEVLKDDDLRKKYDTHGEEGLKEGGPSGRGYKSWNFYKKEFGIYDDDPEIITLSKSDFEQSVDHTEDIWFINFYSPHCSHCHTLAPTWREVGRELEGVIRIGAVNCQDDWQICRQQGIHSYPSLMMYPSKEKYRGEKSTRQLVKHALRQVRAQVVELWSGNWESEIDDDEKKEKPWLISFCGQGGDCLEDDTVTKLAAMLEDLVNVGEITCASNEQICEKMGIESGTYYFDARDVKKGAGIEITTLDAREIAFIALRQLPEVTVLDNEAFENAKKDDMSWLFHFVDGEVSDLELRKLPAMLYNYNVGRIDCKTMRDACNDMHIHKFPVFMVMKPHGKYEIYHGRQTAKDIAAFTKLSTAARVEVLGPEDFPERTVESGDPWFIDFYAPWCPPCMRLLPEFRKASKHLQNVHFGTVDCTVHQNLCITYNIRSYPSTILYNQSVPHQFHGHHNVHALVEFTQDILNPPVMSLTPESFPRLVGRKASDEVWMVDFFSPHCGPCQQLAPEWRKLAKMVKDVKGLHVAQVDCSKHRDLCVGQHVRGYPSIRLYPSGQSDASKFHSYNGWFRDAPSIRAWAYEHLPSKVTVLNWEKVQEILVGSEPWIIDYYAPWCGHCQVFAPEFERVAGALEGKVKAGKVDCDSNQYLCKKAGVNSYPNLRFYQGTTGLKQNIFGEDIGNQNANYLIEFLKQRAAKLNQKRVTDEL